VTGLLVVVFDGCSLTSFAGFRAGAIAVVQRGSCTFVDEVLNAQNSGAVVVVVVNNVAGNPITLSGISPSVVIPSVMLSQDNGANIMFSPASTGVVRAGPA
jgi:hypothetical protein